MWTYYRNGTVLKQKKDKENKDIRFPAISNGPTSFSKDNKSKSHSQRVQELFFSNCLSDHGIVDRKVRTSKRADHQWGTPFSKVSEKAESHIKAHLRDKTLKPLSDVNEHEGLQDDCPRMLQSVVEMEQEGEDEEEGKDGEHLGVRTNSDSRNEGFTASGKRPSEGSSTGHVINTEECPTASGPRYASHAVSADLDGDGVPPYYTNKRKFMVYICGGYKDTVAERSALMDNVFPRLYLYCIRRGYGFKMVDLRLGVGDPVWDTHDTAELHVDALRQCQQTEGPNCVIFLGQKHEIQTLPRTIPKEAFESIVRVVERDRQRMSKRKPAGVDDSSGQSQSSFASGSEAGSSVFEPFDPRYADPLWSSGAASENSISQDALSDVDEDRISPAGARSWADYDRDLTLLHMWYKLDENYYPPVYHLLPISSHHPDFLSGDGQRRRQARKVWHATCLRLWGVLQRSAAAALGEDEAAPLLRTVLDWELEQGLQTLSDDAPPEAHCHCYKRLIPDMQQHLKDEHAAHYIDLLKGRPQVNLTLTAAHQAFVDRLHKKLRHTNIYERDVGWGRKGLDPRHNKSHQFYTERISSHFYRTVLNSLKRVIKMSQTTGSFDRRRKEASRLRIQEEICRHGLHGEALQKNCVSRESFMPELLRAVMGPTPVLLLGPPGWGKSTTLARLAHLAPTWIPGAVVLVTFIGLTGESRNVRLVLQNICVQLAQAYSPETQLSEGLPQLVNEFHFLLVRVGAERPLVLVLDGLDELSDEHGPDLTWLPVPAPPHVHFVLSATTSSVCADNLQTSSQLSVLSLPPLSHDDITAGLESRLHADQRRLQAWQLQLLLQACVSCPSPLYLESAYLETRLWSSFTPQASLGLAPDLAGLYLGLLARLERAHGEQLVRRAAAVVSLSRGGVTEEELLYMLARDGKVLQEVALSHHASSNHPRVPFVLWARLRRDLGGHLTEVETDGTWVLRWTHSHLATVCAGRYLKTAEARMLVHADYADYYRAGGEHGRVFQPLAWTLGEAGEEEEEEEEVEGRGRKSYVFNLRKLNGLSHHLVLSNQILPFLSECVFSYEFLLHKVWGLSVQHIEEDLRKAVLPDREVLDVKVWAGALELARPVLESDPCQLASQILGRLGQRVMEDRPVAPGDPRMFTYLHALLAQCAQSSVPVLVPSYTCMLPPGGLQHTLLAGHSSSVTAVGGGQGGAVAVSSGGDGTLTLWDLEQGRAVRTLEGAGGVVGDALTLGLGEKMVAVRMKQTLQVREVDSGKVVYTDRDSMDVPEVTTACDGQLLVAFYNGSRMVKVLDLASSCSLVCCVYISLDCDPTRGHKDSPILVSHNSIKDSVLFAYRCASQAAVFSAKGGAVRCVLSARHGAASIQGLEMTSDYLLLFCRYPYKLDGEIIHIELFGAASFQYLRSILGCSQDYISQVMVNHSGTYAVALCPSARTGVTDVVTWNLETEDHKHIARFPGVLTAGVCLDLRFCLGVCSGERYLRLWDLTSRIHDQTLTYNVHKQKSDGTQEVVVTATTPRYAVCRSLRPGTVRVWNLAKKRFVGRPVRVEHGLYSSTDIALVHDLKLYILTDRGTATFTDTPSPIFQTLLVYDLIKRGYTRKQTGLYIVPCPQNEYRLLDGQILLGLSETRDHLILWDLESGYIKGRIKPFHKESLLSSNSSIRERLSEISPTKEITTLVMPWDRRTESHSARKRRQEKEAQREKEEQVRLDREKYNAIDQYLLSDDQQVVVCSYFAHHLSVFSVSSQDHLHTLEDRSSLLTLHTAAMTRAGTHLVLAHYSQAQHTSYLTLWDLRKGTVRKRLRKEPGVCCVAITEDAIRVAFGITGSNKLKVWDPFRRDHKTISGYGNLRIVMSSQLYITEGGAKAILLSGEVSLWDLEAGSVLSVLTPDTHVQCLTVLAGTNSRLLLGLSHSPALITVWLTSQTAATATRNTREEDLFGESSSSEEEDM